MLMSRWGKASTILLVLALAGCGGGSSGDDAAGDPTDATTTGTTVDPGSTETTGEPSVEPTGPEQPQDPQVKPAIRNAKLPVGGQVEFDEQGKACFAPGWNGGELPSGVEIRIARYELTDTSVVRFGSGSCPDGPLCQEGSAFGGGANSCYLVLLQVAPGDTVLNIYGDLTCGSLDDCAEVVAEGKRGGGLTITVPEPETPEPTPSPEETPSPAESPSASSSDG
jgi:hypothetical protein